MFGALVRQLQFDRGSHLFRELAGEHAPWGLLEQLMAAQVDAAHGGNWQRGGGKGPRPKPWPRPGVGANTETYRGESVPLDEMKRRFAARRAEWMAEAGEVS